jgi:hypothetical protein
MVMHDLLFGVVFRDPSIVVLKPMNMILASTRIHPLVKEARIRVTFLDVSNTGTLFFSSLFR